MINNFYKLAKTLYHGTSIDNEETIKQYGLVPGGLEGDAGQFTSDLYELDEDDSILPAVFLANKEDISKATTAMKYAISKKLDKSFHDVSEKDIKTYGLMVVVKDDSDDFERVPADNKEKGDWQSMMEEGEEGLSVGHFEPGDFYSLDTVSAGYLLKGNALLKFLRRMGEIKSNYPPASGGISKDISWAKQRLIYLARRVHPNQPKENIAMTVKNLADKDVLSHLSYYEDEIGRMDPENKLKTLASVLFGLGFTKEAIEVDGGYLYHETSHDALPEIIERGLLPTSFGQSLVSEDRRVLSPEEKLAEIRSDLEFEYEDLSDEEFENLVQERFNLEVDQDDLLGRSYVHLEEPKEYAYGEALLRFSASVISKVDKDVDYYITEKISPENIEIKTSHGWSGLI